MGALDGRVEPLQAFFGGVSGKFRWPAIDRMVLVLGAATLAAGLAVMLRVPMG